MSEVESPQPTEPGDATPRLAWWWWAIGAAVLVVAIIVAIVLTQSDDTEPSAVGTASTSTIRASVDPSKSSPPDPASTPTPDEVGSPTPEPPTIEPAPTQTVPVGGEATPEAGVTAEVSKIEAVEGTAELPGEVGGPSLRVTVTIANQTAAELDLSFAVVNLYYGPDLTPALPLGQPGVAPFPASVDARDSASGTYVFNVPADQRDDIAIELDLSVDSTIVLFRGPAGV